MEQLHNLERKPSHQSSSQPHVEPLEVVVIHVVVWQTQHLTKMFKVECTYYGNHWMTTCSTKYIGSKHTSHYWDCIIMCILSIGWTLVQDLSLCGLKQLMRKFIISLQPITPTINCPFENGRVCNQYSIRISATCWATRGGTIPCQSSNFWIRKNGCSSKRSACSINSGNISTY